ncbi:MAG: hydroxymethylbilane synthase [Gemmatimonadetes bacterium]|nr:hydroxymethylbilane synthase [Gemmatimonadota bacterium]
MVNRPLRIASRGSELALWQSRAVEQAIRTADSAVEVEVHVIRTTGDRILDVPLARIGDRGLFTKEIDEAILAGEADLAVHSLKDVPTRLPDGLVLAAISQRADPRDVLICRLGIPPSLDALPAGARVGTSSLRRRSQLLARRPDLNVDDLRGNLNTRLAKLDAGEYDAILLAAAGVLRLGWEERISEYLDPSGWLPAVGQGALAIVTRTDAAEIRDYLYALHDESTAACVRAERAFLRAVEGGCQIPVGALALHDGERLTIEAVIASLDGTTMLRGQESGPVGKPEEIGRALATQLLRRGGDRVLREVRDSAEPIVPPLVGP